MRVGILPLAAMLLAGALLAAPMTSMAAPGLHLAEHAGALKNKDEGVLYYLVGAGGFKSFKGGSDHTP